jgi:hypothetical protein
MLILRLTVFVAIDCPLHFAPLSLSQSEGSEPLENFSLGLVNLRGSAAKFQEGFGSYLQCNEWLECVSYFSFSDARRRGASGECDTSRSHTRRNPEGAAGWRA